MGKDAYWFSHDANAISDPKIVALIITHGMEGYGRYWALIEYLRQQENYRADISQKFFYTSLAGLLRFSVEECKVFIQSCLTDFELIKSDDQFIWSDSLCRRMAKWDAQKLSYSERGKKGAIVTNAKKSAQVETNNSTSETKTGTSGENDMKIPAYKKDDIIKEREALPPTQNILELLIDTDQLKQIANRSGKDLKTADISLKKFHLKLLKNKEYPKEQKEVVLDFEKWLLDEYPVRNNEKNGTNGTNNNIKKAAAGFQTVKAQLA